MKPKVFIARNVPKEVEDYIAEHCIYDKWDRPELIPRDALLASLSDAEGLLTFGGKIDAELLDHAPKLKVVSTMSVGYNHFDLDAMKARGVMGTNTPDVLNETVADLIFALMLAAARRVAELDRYVKEGRWKRGNNQDLFGLDVHHKKLGIIGMGGIGKPLPAGPNGASRWTSCTITAAGSPLPNRSLEPSIAPWMNCFKKPTSSC